MKRLRKTWKRSLTVLCAVGFAIALAVAPPAQPAQANSGYQFPCDGYGVSGYGFGQYVSGWGYHVGEDVCGGAGRPVYAAADGQVVYSALTPESYRWGNLIMIYHDNGDGTQATTIYGHLAGNRQVSAGQNVSKGQLIGFTGPSYSRDNGNWGAHLHFAVKTGPYGAPIGSYASSVTGYLPNYGTYAHPTDYLNGRLTPSETYDYQVAGVDGSGSQSQNAEYYVEVRLKNTGNTTWRINGDAPMRLGTINARDRGSSFSAGMIGHGWAAPSRIALMQDTAPGQIGVFRARFSNKSVPPGYYVERFAPVIEGKRWLADKDIWFGINVRAPQYNAQWVGQNVFADVSANAPINNTNAQSPRYLTPGKKMNVKAFIKNVGDISWSSSGPNPARLGTWGPRDRPSAMATGGDGSIPLSENWPHYTRPSAIDGRLNSDNTITPTSTINPGEVAVFSFTITAPNQPGEYTEHFQPLIEGVTWMNDLGMHFPFKVLPTGYHYEWVGQQEPGTIQLGRTSAHSWIRIRNTGQTPWPTGTKVRLGTWEPRDRVSPFSTNWLSPTRPSAIELNVSNPADPVIHPGQIAQFGFDVQNPGTVKSGTYREYLRPLAENEQWFPEDYGISIPVTVTAPPRDYQVVNQSFSKNINSLKYGDEFTATLAIRNLGTESWQASGNNPLRVGTNSPRDRESGFRVLTGSDPWLSPSRASGIDGRVTNLLTMSTEPDGTIEQTEIATFRIPMKVPSYLPPGPYPEYFNLLQENLSWLPDLGIYFPLNVTGP